MKRSPEVFCTTSGERFMIFLSLADSEGSFNDFETHTAVVVGAFPEPCQVVLLIGCAVSTDAPVPFAVFGVDEMATDIIPTTECFLKCLLIAKVLIEVKKADYRFCLYPPVPVGIACFVCHGAVWL